MKMKREKTCMEPVWRSVMKCNERAVMFCNGAGCPIENGWGAELFVLATIGILRTGGR